ncbi:MAG: hypothetical protein DRO76_00090 [Candidatus Altiarchaeales archaeon]|nr:MAG: hypothetical protein DRO76_00090 [Candidatus Altiarchaeales archaeon]
MGDNMDKKIAIGVIIVLIVLGIGAFLFLSKEAKPEWSDLVPDSNLVMIFDMQKALKVLDDEDIRELYKSLGGEEVNLREKAEEEINKQLGKVGIRAGDISKIVVFGDFPTSVGITSSEVGMLVTGKFDRDRIISGGNLASEESYLEENIYKWVEEKPYGGPKEVFIVFLDDKIVLSEKRDIIKKVIDVKKGKEKPLKKEKLSLLEEVGGNEAIFGIILTISEEMKREWKESMGSIPITGMFKTESFTKLEKMAYSLDKKDSIISLNSVTYYEDKETAESAAKTTRGARDMYSGTIKGLDKLFKDMEIKVEGKKVKMKWEIEIQVIMELIQEYKNMYKDA